MMNIVFVERRLFVKQEGYLVPTVVIIVKPEIISDKKCLCRVFFRDYRKYNAKIHGGDEFNAIECAVLYVKTVCNNSVDPEFFWENGESMRL